MGHLSEDPDTWVVNASDGDPDEMEPYDPPDRDEGPPEGPEWSSDLWDAPLEPDETVPE